MKMIKNILLIFSILLTLYFSLSFKVNSENCEKSNACKCSFHTGHNLKNNFNKHNYNMFFQMENMLSLSMENEVIKKFGCSLCYSSTSLNFEKDLTLLLNSDEKCFERAYLSEINKMSFINNSILKIINIVHFKHNIINIKSVKLNC